MDKLIKELFSMPDGSSGKKKAADLIFAGKGVDPTLDHFDRIALSVAVKDSLY